MAGATIAAVHLRLPELDRDAAERIADADDALAKYDPNEPRDWRGRWTADDNPDATAAAANSDTDAVDVAYQGDYHDQVVAQIAALAKADGAKVITSVNLVAINGATARADLLIIPPSGEPLILLEVKTGEKPKYTPGQRVVYPMAQIGNHIFSPDPKIRELGFAPGELLPAMSFVTLYKKDAASPFIPLPGDDPRLP
jgi:hypothetical protein